MIHNVAVLGVGGVGGYFGGKLCQKSNLNISFIARGEHLRAIQQNSLLLSTDAEGDLVCKPTLATDQISSLPPPDLILLCVKEFDLRVVLLELKPSIRAETIILPLLNGMDVYGRIRAVISSGIVLPACVYVGTHIERPGKVTQRGGACKILFGSDPQHPKFNPDALLKLLAEAKIKCEWTQNVQEEIWTKFIFICAFGTVTAAHNKTVGEVFENEVLRSDVATIMHEIVSLAKASNIILPPDVIDKSLAKAKSFPFETKTSFQRDFERADKPDERDLFAGAVLSNAARLHVEVPKTRELLQRLNKIKPQALSTARM
jgi:2-dehydropantoate 2-reductase